jgi:DNA-binding transcriptional ArsR family regulator
MDSKHLILKYLSQGGLTSARALREHLGVSRQALSVHMRELLRTGKVLRSGSTKAAQYALAGRAPSALSRRLALPLQGLDEAAVFDRLSVALSLKARLRSNVEALVHYAFTEMLNNAIDHSEAQRCLVHVRLSPAAVAFEVRDPGIGVFHSIARKLGLPDEQAALVELLKGKTTTMRERHTGEGIFFTARAADRFVLRSHRIRMEWDGARRDVFVSAPRLLGGTQVAFQVARASRRRLEDVFAEFAPAEFDYRFEKTRVLVKLLQRDYVSRSEAKRLLLGLEKFREVVLDFRDVGSVGQGFADEVFRVFAAAHPEVKVTFEDASPAVVAMLRHAGASG